MYNGADLDFRKRNGLQKTLSRGDKYDLREYYDAKPAPEIGTVPPTARMLIMKPL